jgi:hypothetical protein
MTSRVCPATTDPAISHRTDHLGQALDRLVEKSTWAPAKVGEP